MSFGVCEHDKSDPVLAILHRWYLLLNLRRSMASNAGLAGYGVAHNHDS
jgi:hypothetical protein